MAVRVRAIEPGEAEALARLVFTAFGQTPRAGEVEDELAWIDTDRLLAAEDGGEMVGAAGAYSFDMSVPGGARVPVAGVTWVGVLPTHRRRGVLTAMMRAQLDGVVERGEPIAVLTASEAGIYGRFGYGLASRLAKVRIDTTGGLPLASEPDVAGRCRLVSAEVAEPHARRLVAAEQGRRTGELNRPDRWWPVFLRDPEDRREGASGRFWVLHETPGGEVDGVAHYRVKRHWGDDDAVPRNEVQLGDVWARDAHVEAALLAFLADVDLTSSITTWARPVDDPFRLRLADDRRYRVELVHDHLYVRVLDVPAALEVRAYEAPGSAVLAVDDPLRPASSGRYRLDVDDAGRGRCERLGGLHDSDADAFLTVTALGSAYLGEATAVQLADAGWLKPSSTAALETIDRMLRTPRKPYCTMEF